MSKAQQNILNVYSKTANLGGALANNTTVTSPGLFYPTYGSTTTTQTITSKSWMDSTYINPINSGSGTYVNTDNILNSLDKLSKKYEVTLDWGKEIVVYTTGINKEIIVLLRMWDINEDNFMRLLETAMSTMNDIGNLSITHELFDYSYTNKRLKQIKDFYETNYTLNYSEYIIELVNKAQTDVMQEEVNKINEEMKSQKINLDDNFDF